MMMTMMMIYLGDMRGDDGSAHSSARGGKGNFFIIPTTTTIIIISSDDLPTKNWEQLNTIITQQLTFLQNNEGKVGQVTAVSGQLVLKLVL